MKNPLDTLAGTALCGIVLTLVMYWCARIALGG
jgi:hypothetical protein